MAVTPYVETEALLAVLEDDIPRARQLVADMLPGERLAFHMQLDTLMHVVSDTP